MDRSFTSDIAPPTMLILDRLRLRRAATAALVRPWAEMQALTVTTADPDEFQDIHDDLPAPLVALLNIGSASIRDIWHRPPAGIMGGGRNIPCIVLSDSDDPREVVMAAQCGLQAFLPASTAPELALQAIGFVIQGGTYFPREAFLADPVAPHRPQAATVVVPLSTSLTKRQCEVLKGLRVGLSNKSIGRDLDMQESTVKVHVRQIMRKLGANNRTQAAMLAGQLDPSEAVPERN